MWCARTSNEQRVQPVYVNDSLNKRFPTRTRQRRYSNHALIRATSKHFPGTGIY